MRLERENRSWQLSFFKLRALSGIDIWLYNNVHSNADEVVVGDA